MNDSVKNTNPSTLHQDTSEDALKFSIAHHLKYSQAKSPRTATLMDHYNSIAFAVRDRLVEKWIETQNRYFTKDPKRIYYLSMEYLVGRALSNYLVNLDFKKEICRAIEKLGLDLERIEQNDIEAGLGNGGLGRLAACFMDSMATLGLPAMGYGMRYEYGIFYQKIIDGYQVETADNWLRKGYPWELPRPDYLYPIRFYGYVQHTSDQEGRGICHWLDSHDDVMAMAYDIPIPGFHNQTVNNLRLWSARSTREFDFGSFNEGDYVQAVTHKHESETLSKVLYPNDSNMQGKELRLKQEFFFVSASLQDILRRYKRNHSTFEQFTQKIAIQLNDTHPALAIPELMRLLVDREHRPWQEAWEIALKTFAYTNHTVLPEALEKWPVGLLQHVLPRHLEIIYQINQDFLSRVQVQHPGNPGLLKRISIVEEQPVKSIRMANLAIVGSHTVNGVAALHSDILKKQVFPDFNKLFPNRFTNVTNGITQRLWLKSCNPELANLLNETIGEDWVTDLSHMKKLVKHIDDASFRERWRQVKQSNKQRLAQYIRVDRALRLEVDPDTLFDVQIKRIHEYKRQLLCLLHTIVLYNRFKENPDCDHVPRTVMFAGKAAPGYEQAKLIIKLITSVADKLNQDVQTAGKLKLVFIPNYSVNKAEGIIPGADLSEQISTAGMEASGTGNMKLALNGALTIGTLDGANIEIKNEVGDDNIFIFGLTADQVDATKAKGYNPRDHYENNPELRKALDMIRDGYFSPDHPHLFQPIIDALLVQGDRFMVMADFAGYIEKQKEVEALFVQPEAWTRKSILNAAHMGLFSSDRAIRQYSEQIWDVHPLTE
ncbi:glycogen/starch/alpha-glucan phosphorylase [Nitrospina watsonii]|uniref:Alpha-1,4 glucan phosphorylase n=1 Tax=Nitrospina watsonii TaxID=1323948 RepID=A0ABN8W4A3_9BACT|nr:glycogen/starch/alpha-glucan phosphorylase [Nitrospina watsonii]CAI2718466.1 glycogen phosphorylase [Nitrospina watsonii]